MSMSSWTELLLSSPEGQLLGGGAAAVEGEDAELRLLVLGHQLGQGEQAGDQQAQLQGDVGHQAVSISMN